MEARTAALDMDRDTAQRQAIIEIERGSGWVCIAWKNASSWIYGVTEHWSRFHRYGTWRETERPPPALLGLSFGVLNRVRGFTVL